MIRSRIFAKYNTSIFSVILGSEKVMFDTTRERDDEYIY